MIVAHLTSAHPPDDIRIRLKECRALVAAYPGLVLVAPEPAEPGTARSIDDGVTWLAVRRSRGRLARMTIGCARVFAAALRSRARLCHIHDPELLPWGLLLRLCGRWVVYDAHEDLPGSVSTKHWIAASVRGWLSRVVDRAERALASGMSGVVAATPRIAARFAAHPQVAVVQNFPLDDEVDALWRGPDAAGAGPPARARPRHVVYAGAISRGRGLATMLAAVAGSRMDRLVLLGRFAPPGLLAEAAADPAWPRVRHLGWQPREAMRAAFDAARAGLILLQPEPNYVESQPTKMFEYMAAGLPVVASDYPLWRAIIVDGHPDGPVGWVVDPLDPAQAARALDWLLDHPDEADAMGRRGRELVQSTYRWSREAECLLAFYRRIAG